MTPLLGCVADDFTGASDLANTLAQGGMATVQFNGLPAGDAPAPPWQAAVIALKSRSIPAPEAVAQSLAALRWLRGRGCRQILFKYCSTFDSTPAGNIGPVGEALADALGAAGVVACPAFPETGRTVFQGHLFVGDRLLSESGLQHHPLNPMTDPDLRRWLHRQTAAPVGLVSLETVRRGAGAIRDALADAAGRGERLAIVDAVEDADLRAIGRACAGSPLVTGGSGVARGLPQNFRDAGLLGEPAPAFAPVAGPGAALAGSCSGATRAQVAAYAAARPSLAVDPEAVLAGRLGVDDLLAFAAAHRDDEPLLFSSAPPDAVAALQARHGRERVSEALERLFADAASGLVRAGVRRLVVAGGETAGAVVSALSVSAFAVGPEIDPGVPALGALGGGLPPLALALKSGNFGGPDFFAKALAVLGPRA